MPPIISKWIAQIILVSAIAVLLLFTGYQYGTKQAVKDKLSELQKANAQTAIVQARLDKLVAQTTVQYVEKIRIVKQKGDTIVKKIPTYITASNDSDCIIADNFRVLWNEANTIDPSPTGSTDGATATDIIDAVTSP